MFKKIITFLNQPYPLEQDLKRDIITILAFGIFIPLFIILFIWNDYRGWIDLALIAGFGCITMVVMALNMLLLPPILPAFFKEEKWTVLKEICIHLWIIFLIGLGNLLYGNWGGAISFSWDAIVQVQFITLMVGAFPVTVMVLMKQNRLLKQYVAEAGEINTTLPPHTEKTRSAAPEETAILLTSENEREQLRCFPDQLMVIKAVDNYVEVCLREPSGIRTHLLRNTLKTIEGYLEHYPQLFRCHRSFLINLAKITKISGNSQGYRVSVDGISDTIPVARTNSRQFKERMAAL